MSSARFARLTFLLEPELKRQFEELCAAQDITASQLMRQLLRAQVAAHASEIPATSKPARKSDRPRK